MLRNSKFIISLILLLWASQACAQGVGSVSSSGGGNGTIIAGTTPTSGVTSGNLIGSTGNLAVDSGIAFANVDTLSGNQTLTGFKNFNNANGIKITTGSLLPFQILGSPNGATTLPVPTFYPVGNNQIMALDISPRGTPTDIGYGLSWIDPCGTDQVNGTGTSPNCVHISTHASFVEVSGAEFNNGGAFISLQLGVRSDASFFNLINLTPAGTVQFPFVATDAAIADRSLCLGSAAPQTVYFGSGTLGACLGTSSLRFKHDVADLDVGLKQILDLKPISFKMNEGYGDPQKPMYGFAAEQGAEVIPKLAGHDIEGKPSSFDYLGVVPVLVKAVQEQQAEIEHLKSRWCLGRLCWE